MSLKKALRIILSQISFFTILPSPSEDIRTVAKYSYLSPIIIGTISSIIEFIIYLLLFQIIGNNSKYIIIITAEILRGFNHLDGLLDFGDALMIRGNRDKKLMALKDTYVGTGGLGMLMIYIIISITTLPMLKEPSLFSFFSLLSSEILCRSGALILLSITPPIPESELGKVFHEYLRDRLIYLLIISIPFLLSFFTIILFLTLIILFRFISIKTLGGISGDAIGAFITISFPLLIAVSSCCSLSLYHYLLISS
jgi:adenosylcobinamide-GDP ribazoletransferase